eukprot:SAG31_NODE_3990_length_3681_cov_2.353992_1_plen_65_part_00
MDAMDNPLLEGAGVAAADKAADAIWDRTMESALGELKASGSGAERTVVKLLRQREEQVRCFEVS